MKLLIFLVQIVSILSLDCSFATNATICCDTTVLAFCSEQCNKITVEYCPKMLKQIMESRYVKSGQISRPVFSTDTNLFSPSQKYKQLEMCGTVSSTFIPCVSRKKANDIFQFCCQKFVDANCLDLCRFETKGSNAINAFNTAMAKNCSLTNMSAILYCASQNRNNKQCCTHFKLGTRTQNPACLKFCDPSKNKIGTLTNNDLVCLQNWNVLMFCHLSGLT